MAMRKLLAASLACGLIVAAGTRMIGPAVADDPKPSGANVGAHVAAGNANSRVVALGVGKSLVVDLPRDVRDVLVSNPKIANAVVRSSRRAYLIGVEAGQTDIYFFDGDGHQIAGYDIAVTPGADTRVINSLTNHTRDQVMLKVMVAEVQRDLIKQLGVNLNGTLGYGATVLNFATTNPFSVSGQSLSGSFASIATPSITATLQAMERAGVIRTLAEPNLTAISGESASFIAGGEFPIPGGFGCDPTTRLCSTTVLYKKFGVGLNFTPVVLSEGRISLKVMSEVSELSNENALTLQQAFGNGVTQTLTLPSVKTRRAETTLEIPSGGSLAMAGMIQEQTKQAINGIPGLMQIPILGALFKSRDYINRQTELMVIVTPYVVHAVAQKNLSLPDDGFADASDPSTVLLGRLTRIYGVVRPAESSRTYHGNYGFILD